MHLIVPDELVGKQLDTEVLPHPRTGEDSLFFTCDQGSVYEAVKFCQKIGCLFVGDAVDPDASISILTPVDPLFFLLPLLIQHRKQFRTVRDLFEDSSEFLKSLSETHCSSLNLLCDVRDVDDDQYYRVSDDKVISWLKFKIEAISTELDRKSISTSTLSVGMEKLTFLGSTASNSDDKLAYACTLLSDYLPPDVTTELRQNLKIADFVTESSGAQAAAAPLSLSNNGKVKPKEDYFVDEKYGMKTDEPKLTRSQKQQKQLAKVDKTGMKSITSFFSAKPKK